MGTYWWLQINLIVLASLLFCSVSMQPCLNSTTQFPIEFNFYHNGSASDIYETRDILVDSNINQYMFYSPDADHQNVHLTKINSNGTFEWSKEYPGLIILPEYQVTQMSNNETSIRLIGATSAGIGQLAEIATSDGTLNIATQFSTLEITTTSYASTLKCSRNTDSLWFFNWQGSSGSDHKVCKADFTNLSTINYADPDNTNLRMSTIDALDDENFIVGGFDSESTPHKHVFYSSNISATSMNWAVQADALEDYYTITSRRLYYSYINDASTKYVWSTQLSTTFIVFVFYPSNGSLIEAKQLGYDSSFTNPKIDANGRISDNKIVHSIKVASTSRCFVTFINIDTWELKSFYAEGSIRLKGLSSLFSTDQIFMAFIYSPNYFTMRAAYDKLNYTELFKPMENTIEDVTLTF